MDQWTRKRKTRTRNNGNSSSTTSCKPTHIQTRPGIRTASKMAMLRGRATRIRVRRPTQCAQTGRGATLGNSSRVQTSVFHVGSWSYKKELLQSQWKGGQCTSLAKLNGIKATTWFSVWLLFLEFQFFFFFLLWLHAFIHVYSFARKFGVKLKALDLQLIVCRLKEDERLIDKQVELVLIHVKWKSR